MLNGNNLVHRNLFSKSHQRNQEKQQKSPHHSSSLSACSHIARETTDYLKDKNIELMSHCPNSFDLWPKDFFLFLYVKQKLRGQRFSPPQEAVDVSQTMFLRYQF